VIGKKFWDTPWWTHSPEMQDKLKDGISRAKNGEFIRFEANHLDNEKKVHYVDFSIKPVFDDNGKVIYMVPEGRDVTEMKKTEDELRLRNIVLQTQQETTMDGVLVVDGENKIISYNKNFLKMWNIPDEVIKTKSDETAINFILNQLLSPEQFTERVKYL
jgi:PAS domain-containing protein